jgi:hypothetical protein
MPVQKMFPAKKLFGVPWRIAARENNAGLDRQGK